jgi:hypothetical protein
VFCLIKHGDNITFILPLKRIIKLAVMLLNIRFILNTASGAEVMQISEILAFVRHTTNSGTQTDRSIRVLHLHWLRRLEFSEFPNIRHSSWITVKMEAASYSEALASINLHDSMLMILISVSTWDTFYLYRAT